MSERACEERNKKYRTTPPRGASRGGVVLYVRPLFGGHDCGKASPPFQKLRMGKRVTIEHGGVSQIHSIAISTCHNNQVTARIFTRRKAHDYRGPLIRNSDDLI